MKKMRVFYLVAVLALLTVSVVMFSGIAQAGAVPDGFAGIPWGASKDQIIKTMNERGYRQYTGTAPGQLEFKGAFAGAHCDLIFLLIANSFYWGSANSCDRFPYPMPPQETYRRMVEMLSEKFGPPQRRRESITGKTNDGREYPDWSATWNLVDSRTSDKYSITVYFHVTWFVDTTGDQYVVDINYSADSLEKRLKMKEY